MKKNLFVHKVRGQKRHGQHYYSEKKEFESIDKRNVKVGRSVALREFPKNSHVVIKRPVRYALLFYLKSHYERTEILHEIKNDKVD